MAHAGRPPANGAVRNAPPPSLITKILRYLSIIIVLLAIFGSINSFTTRKQPIVTPIECPSSDSVDRIKQYHFPREIEEIIFESMGPTLTNTSCDVLETWLIGNRILDGKSKALAQHTYQSRCVEAVNQPFYAFKLLYLLEQKGNCTNVSGKDIVVQIGRSGAGKSSNVDFINGRKMIPNGTRVDVEGGSGIIGHSTMASVTQKITCFKVEDYDKLICDTPGFRDTGGPEAELAHGKELGSLFKNSRSFIPIYVLSVKDMTKVLKLAPVWDSYALFMNESLCKTHNFVWFTKGSSDEAQDILATALKVDKLDKNQTFVANFLLAGLRSGGSSVSAFDPLKANRDEVKNALTRHPSLTWEQIQNPIPREALEIYEKDIEQTEIKFLNFIKQGDYASLEFYLQVFDEIYKYLPTDKAQMEIAKLKKIVENHFDNLKYEYKKDAKDYLYNLWNPTKSDLNKYLVKDFKEQQSLAKYIGYSFTKEDLNLSTCNVLESTIDDIISSFSPQANECLPSEELAKRVARVHSFGSPFKTLISSLDRKITDKARICFSNLRNSYNNPDKMNAKFTNLLDYERLFNLPDPGIPSYSDAISSYKAYVTDSARKCFNGLLPEVGRNAVSSAEDFRTILKARLPDHWEYFDKDLREVFNVELSSYFETADKIITSDLSHDWQGDIKFIHRTVEFMKEVGFEEFHFDIKFIEKQKDLEVAIVTKMDGMTNIVDIMREFFDVAQTSYLDISPIRTKIEKIASFTWLESYFSVSINSCLDTVRGLVTRYFNQSLEQVEFDLALKDFAKIKNFSHKLRSISDSEGIISDTQIANLTDTFQGILDKYVDNVLNQTNGELELCGYLQLLTPLKGSHLFRKHNQIGIELKDAFDRDLQQLFSSAESDITFFSTTNTFTTRNLVEKILAIKTCPELDGPQNLLRLQEHIHRFQTFFTMRYVDCETKEQNCETIRGDFTKIVEWTKLRDPDIHADVTIYEKYRRCTRSCDGLLEEEFKQALEWGAYEIVKSEIDSCQVSDMCTRYQHIVRQCMYNLRSKIDYVNSFRQISSQNGDLNKFLRIVASGITNNTDYSATVNRIYDLFKREKQEIEALYDEGSLKEAKRRTEDYNTSLFSLNPEIVRSRNLTISVDVNNIIDTLLENCLTEPAFMRLCLPDITDVSRSEQKKIDHILSQKISKKWNNASDKFIASLLRAFESNDDRYPKTCIFIGQKKSENEDYFHNWDQHGIVPGPNVRLLPSTIDVIQKRFSDTSTDITILDQNVVNNYNKLNNFAQHKTTFSKLPEHLQNKFKDFKNKIEQNEHWLDSEIQRVINTNGIYDTYLEQYLLLRSVDRSSALCKKAVEITKIHKQIIYDSLAEFKFNFGSSLENINYYNTLYLQCTKEHDNPIHDIKNQLLTISGDLLRELQNFQYDGTNLGDFERVVTLLDEIYRMKNVLKIDMTEHKQAIKNFFEEKMKQSALLIRRFAPSDPEFRQVNDLYHPLKYLVQKGPLGEDFQIQWADKINDVVNFIQSRQHSNIYESLVYIAEYQYALQEADITSKLERTIDTHILALSDKEARDLHGKLMTSQDYNANFLAHGHSRFQNMNLCDFNDLVATHDINYVLDNLRGEDIDKDLLLRLHQSYLDTYNSLIAEYKVKLDSKMEIIDNLLKGKQQTVPQMLAHIFAFWSLSNFQPGQSCLWEVHPAQLVTIFRIFELDQPHSRIDMFKSFIWGPKKINNHIVQLGTGEGKSIVLAATASVFALLGYDVDVVCYSQYLTERDSAVFLPLFKALGVEDNIMYATIRDVSESIIDENGSIREAMKNFILNPHVAPSSPSNGKGKRERVLLVDEVDVFFSENFLGKTHDPILILNDPLSRKLVELVWNLPDVNQVKKSVEYKNWVSAHPEFKEHLDCQLEYMVKDRAIFNDPPFKIHNSRIGYKQDDGYATNIHYGYRTIFAYLSLASSNQIDPAALEENIGIRIPCGSFSYAEIPKRYKHIFGATGTLSTLTDPQKQLLKEEYYISKETFVPSIFGKSNREFKEIADFKIVVDGHENLDEWMIEIADEIATALAAERAILVVFKDEWALTKFKDSPYCKPFLQNIQFLLPSTENIEDIVRHASKRATVTLMTREFGRGSDFICRDKTVKENGGVVVVQTFFSDDPAEDIQIPGRTARQGQKGSFKLVVHANDLIQLGFPISDIQTKIDSRTNIYQEAIEARNRKFSAEIGKIDINIKTVRPVHLNTINFHQQLLSGGHNAAAIMKIFYEIVPKCYNSKGYHVIFVLDRSGSMAGWRWKGLKDSVNKFVDKRRPDGSNDMVSVILYDDYAIVPCDSLEFTDDFNVNDCIVYNGGGTSYEAGLKAAIDVLDKNDHSTYTPLLLFLSDGECLGGDKEMKEISDRFSGVGILVKVLSFGNTGDSRLQEIARLGGGSFVAAVDNIELERAFVDIAVDLVPGVNARIP